MRKGKFGLLAIAAAAAGCASPAAQPPADGAPAGRTAVFETHVASSGVLGVLPFEMTERHYVRTNMRRDEASIKGTGTFTGFFLSALAGDSDAQIARLDRKVLWKVSDGRKEYAECPIYGCPPKQAAAPVEERRRQQPGPARKSEPACVMRIASSTMSVKPTGRKEQINGFDTEQYAGAWVVKLRDAKRRVSTSTLSFDVWTSPVTAQMREAFGTDQTFARAYAVNSPSGTARPRTAAGRVAADRSQVLPPEVAPLMLGYLSSLSPGDRAAFSNAGRQLSKIKGHPIRTRIEWRLAGDACAEKPLPAGGAPILSFSVEVKALRVQPVNDGFFAVPAGYKRINPAASAPGG